MATARARNRAGLLFRVFDANSDGVLKLHQRGRNHAEHCRLISHGVERVWVGRRPTQPPTLHTCSSWPAPRALVGRREQDTTQQDSRTSECTGEEIGLSCCCCFDWKDR
eukprot:4643707-Prymnesium_polylepis.2